jgi:hypothetical protein
MSSIKRFLLSLLVISVAVAGSLELFSFVLSQFHLLPVSETPRFYASESTWKESESNWRTERDPWGAWHKPNTVGIGQKPCFRVEYRTNSIGARGNEFALKDTSPRILLLGDSFAEGYGVNDVDSAARQIESLTGTQVLNFGAGGDLGPLQYGILYDRLAAQYDHDILVVFFLPANDFTDNDYEFWKSTGANLAVGANNERWRPYSRRRDDGTFETFFPPGAVRRDAWSSHSDDPLTVHQFVRDHFWSVNVWRSVRLLLLSRRISAAQGKGKDGQMFSGYFDVPADRQQAALHAMKALVHSSLARQIVIAAIPTAPDLARVAAGEDPRTTPWRKSLEGIAMTVADKDFRFVDLADSFPTNASNLFSVCDGHWTPEGNRLAAETISRSISVMTN